MLKLKNVTKSYNTVEVLRGISTVFESFGLYGIVGPNGTGKTTLMKCLLGLTDYSGDIVIGDEKSSVSFAYLPEILTIYPYLTGREIVNLLIQIQNKNNEIVWNNINILAQDLNYTDFDKLASAHSKGNLRKLFLMYALGVEAKYVFLDEPFSGLDPVSVALVKKVLVYQKGKSFIIMNTHFFDSAKEICDYIYFLKDGKILRVANKEEIQQLDLLELYGNE
jgi:ABC-2 type transport system ATP-binding protein